MQLLYGPLSSVVCEQQRCSLLSTFVIAYWKISYLDLLWAKFKFLASLCSLAGWFESHFVENPENRFSRSQAHICLKKSMIAAYLVWDWQVWNLYGLLVMHQVLDILWDVNDDIE